MIERTHQTTGVLVPTYSVARYSDCERYRYYLKRTWDFTLPVVNYLMLNPSTATEKQNDPTLARCESRARNWSYGSMVITNLFAYRATDPKDMKRQADPVGPENMNQIREAANEADLIICGWGQHGRHLSQDAWAIKQLGMIDLPAKVHALRITNGVPWHPLYLSYELKPIPFPEAV
jgi:hypothetical protein